MCNIAMASTSQMVTIFEKLYIRIHANRLDRQPKK